MLPCSFSVIIRYDDELPEFESNRRILQMVVWVLATSTVLGAGGVADASIGPGDEYRINWARAAQGANVVESAEIHLATAVRNLVGARLNEGEGKQNGTTIFADGTGQRERFVIDLGCERLVGRVFVGSHAPDGKRHPDSVTIRGSLQSHQGPWRVLVADGEMQRQYTFAFDNTPVRFLEVDFGESRPSSPPSESTSATGRS